MENGFRSNDLSNRVVSAFALTLKALEAKSAIIQCGIDDAQIEVMVGRDAARNVDTSANWFADTDEQIKKYKRYLLDGMTLLTVPVKDHRKGEELCQILSAHGATHITHFGEWITEVVT